MGQGLLSAGVDVLSFGGTKNGLMLGEAVVFFDAALADDFLYLRKQTMQLASKMRFLAAQFENALGGKRDTVNCGGGQSVAVVTHQDRVLNCPYVLYSLKLPPGAPAVEQRAVKQLAADLRARPPRNPWLAK